MLPSSSSQAAEIGTVTPEEAQVPGMTGGNQAPNTEPQTEVKPLTEAEVRRIAKEVAEPLAQSFSGKAENRMRQEIVERIQSLEATKAYHKMTPEQMQAARLDIVADVMSAVPEEEDIPPASPSAQAKTDGMQLHPIISEAYALMEDEGVFVREEDPEFEKYIKPALTGPTITRKVIKATALAIEAKMQREASNKEKAALRTPGRPAGSGGQQTKLTPEEKISAGLRGQFSNGKPPGR